jgi:hypothetical protein
MFKHISSDEIFINAVLDFDGSKFFLLKTSQLFLDD